MRAFSGPALAIALALGISAGANILLNVALGRSLGVEALGTFALGVSVARILYAFTDLGLSSHLIRGASRDKSSARELTNLFLTFRASIVPLVILATAVVGGVLHDRAVVFALVAGAIGLLSLQSLFEAVLLGHQHQREVAVLLICSSVCVAVACVLWLAIAGSLLLFVFMYAIAAAVGVCFWMYRTGRGLSIWPRWHVDRRRFTQELQGSWPIGLSILLGVGAAKVPVLALAVFGTPGDVGAFAAADMFVTATAILQTAVTTATFPQLASSFRTAPANFRRIYWASNAVLAIAGLAIAVFLHFFGHHVVSLVFPSKDFAKTTELTVLLGWSTPALLLIHHNILVYAASDRERMNLGLMAGWFGVIAVLQLSFAPLYGTVGAGWAVLLGRTVGLVAIGVAAFATSIHRGGEPVVPSE